MKIEVSNGELADKLTILEIKLEKIKDDNKLENIRKEYNALNGALKDIIDKKDPLYKKLYDINLRLWNIEDRIREYERKKDFGVGFIETSRSVYFTNDLRARIKKDINEKTGSNLTEEKSYEDY